MVTMVMTATRFVLLAQHSRMDQHLQRVMSLVVALTLSTTFASTLKTASI